MSAVNQEQLGSPVNDGDLYTSDDEPRRQLTAAEKIEELTEAAGHLRSAVRAIQGTQLDTSLPLALDQLRDNRLNLDLEVLCQETLERTHKRILDYRQDIERERIAAEREAMRRELQPEKGGADGGFVTPRSSQTLQVTLVRPGAI
jgi:hypothetical protein